MKLLKTQKNQLFDIISQASLNPLDFEIREENVNASHGYETFVDFKGTDYYFSFHDGSVSYFPIEDNLGMLLSLDIWDIKKDYFIDWIRCLKREITAPDKWSELLKASEEITWKVEEGDISPFTEQQLLEIEASISQIKLRFEEVDLLPQQLTLIYKRLDYINEKAMSIGKLDWKNLAMGTMVNLMVELALSPEKRTIVWTLFKQVFQPFLLIQLP